MSHTILLTISAVHYSDKFMRISEMQNKTVEFLPPILSTMGPMKGEVMAPMKDPTWKERHLNSRTLHVKVGSYRSSKKNDLSGREQRVRGLSQRCPDED